MVHHFSLSAACGEPLFLVISSEGSKRKLLANFKISFGICQCVLDCFGGLVDFNTGGKKVIERLVEAYGFTTRQALCDHLGVSKSTMATRYMRDIFPADWVLQCAIETGSSLKWLSFGVGEKKDAVKNETRILEKKILIDGKLEDDGTYLFDTKFLPQNLKKAIVVSTLSSELICDMEFEDVRDGKWLVNIDGENSFRMITRLPGGRIHITSKNHSFECALKDIEIIAKVEVSCFR
ncbi:TPA: phage repressor protein CI [Klebsiella pneumoniae]|nr:phage repressor protein CI [Klebsiella pneumoniae]HBR7659196.1 phage repressor protein CI [Klebsiella pneumoniae]HBS7749467.1 phage repressor protein CI [Klebsiella pneumoniae]